MQSITLLYKFADLLPCMGNNIRFEVAELLLEDNLNLFFLLIFLDSPFIEPNQLVKNAQQV